MELEDRSIRPREYIEHTTGLCNECIRPVQARIEIGAEKEVHMIKKCRDHGTQDVLIASDSDYWRNARNYTKKGEIPAKFNTRTDFGCPLDCGLCEDHQQHSCLSVVEITDNCNLDCPTCYAGSGAGGKHRPFEQVKNMIDCVVRSEGKPDVVQISGGEPTIHPDFFKILDYARSQPIKHLMVNTNGIRIASEKGFTQRLAEYSPYFELYLQFDSLRDEALQTLRGARLNRVRLSALEKLNELNLSTTLVSTVQRGVNDNDIGETIEFASRQKAVRGVTFQPVQVAGRNIDFDPAKNRYTLTDVRTAILQQTGMFKPEDIIPVPCNPDSLAMAYAFKSGKNILPLTRYVNPQDLLDGSKNTILLEQQPDLVGMAVKLFSTGNSPLDRIKQAGHLLCCLPEVCQTDGKAPKYDNVFRVIINRFMDKYDFDVRSARKICISIAHPDGKRMMPFDTMNILYRGNLEQTLLAQRRREVLATYQK